MNNKSGILIPYTLSALLLILSVILLVRSKNSSKELIIEKQAGALLGEINEKLKRDLSITRDDLTKNIRDYDEIIKSNESIIEENQAKIKKLLYENNLGNNARKQLKEIQHSNDMLQIDLDVARSQYASLLKQADIQGSQIAALEEKNLRLREQLESMRRMISDNVSIAAFKGKKSKLTVVAARADLLSVRLDIPSSSSNNLNFKVIFPGGAKVPSKELPDSQIHIAQVSSNTFIDDEMKSVQILYKPEQKLKKGEYRMLIYSGESYLTGININLK